MPLALDESQIEYLTDFRTFKNKSVVNATRSLINYFRDICPHLLPKKLRGRFMEVDEDTKKENVTVYGRQKVFTDIDGLDLLKKAEKLPDDYNMATERILTDADLKKIRYLKLKNVVKRVDRKGFRDSDEEVEEVKDGEEDKSLDGEGEESEEEEDEGEEIEGEDIEGEESEEEGDEGSYNSEDALEGEESEGEEVESDEEEEEAKGKKGV
jgi:hypothetical protein